MARHFIKNVLLISLVTLCILAGKGESRPNDDAQYEDDYANDDNNDNYDEDELDEGQRQGNDTDAEQAYTGPPPSITSKPLTITIQPGSTVWLPCDISNIGQSVIMWNNDSKPMWVGVVQTNHNPRLHKYVNNTVRISNVESSDSGAYSCQIALTPPLTIVHTLHVPSPAHIIEMRPIIDKEKLPKKGENLTLECVVSGYPKPAITWMRKDKDKRMPSGEEKSTFISINFSNINRHHEGKYECMASNSGGSDVKTIDIHIEYAPEIHIEKETVITDEDIESEMTCSVHANPPAVVEWYRDGKLVTVSKRVFISKDQEKNILKLSTTKTDDLGSYTCQAHNTIGSTTKNVTLSVKPSQPKFEMKTSSSNAKMLTWKFESIAPIIEYELEFRQENKNDWVKSSPSPVVDNNDGKKFYTVQHQISDLDPGKYEARVKARNSFGWSDLSQVHQFSTEHSTSGVETLRPTVFSTLTVIGVCAYFL